MYNRLVATAALVVIAMCTLSCGGGSSPPTAPSPASSFVITVTRENGAQSFSPSPAAAGGQMVVFKNADTIVHRVLLNDGSVDTGNIAPGATSTSVRMPDAGTNYHCSLHPDMIGAVNPAVGGPPPVCTGIYC